MKIIYMEATINYIAQVNYPLVTEIINNGVVAKETKDGLKKLVIVTKEEEEE